YFLAPEMGSIHFVSNPTVPLDSIELMVCLDLVGSPLGGPDIAEELRDLVVVSGAERAGLGALVDDTPTEGVTLRRIGADIVPPLSDHFAFHSAGDRKSTRLNSSHVKISYAVFCLTKK